MLDEEISALVFLQRFLETEFAGFDVRENLLESAMASSKFLGAGWVFLGMANGRMIAERLENGERDHAALPMICLRRGGEL